MPRACNTCTKLHLTICAGDPIEGHPEWCYSYHGRGTELYCHGASAGVGDTIFPCILADGHPSIRHGGHPFCVLSKYPIANVLGTGTSFEVFCGTIFRHFGSQFMCTRSRGHSDEHEAQSLNVPGIALLRWEGERATPQPPYSPDMLLVAAWAPTNTERLRASEEEVAAFTTPVQSSEKQFFHDACATCTQAPCTPTPRRWCRTYHGTGHSFHCRGLAIQIDNFPDRLVRTREHICRLPDGHSGLHEAISDVFLADYPSGLHEAISDVFLADYPIGSETECQAVSSANPHHVCRRPAGHSGEHEAHYKGTLSHYRPGEFAAARWSDATPTAAPSAGASAPHRNGATAQGPKMDLARIATWRSTVGQALSGINNFVASVSPQLLTQFPAPPPKPPLSDTAKRFRKLAEELDKEGEK